jgi:ADP-ribose pyrophosphatase YjhB (NUDIX family)
MDQQQPIRATSSKTAYQNPWMKVREDTVTKADGTEGIYGVIETKDSVIIAAVNKKNEIYCINSFSYPTGVWGWWLPGGGGEGESPEVAGARELVEESGITATSWNVLGTVRVCNGLMTEKMSVLLARDLTQGEKPGADDDIMIKGGQFMGIDTIKDMIQSGDIDDGQTIAALYLVQNWLGKN